MEHGFFSFDRNSCHLDTFMLAEIACVIAHPGRLKGMDLPNMPFTKMLLETVSHFADPLPDYSYGRSNTEPAATSRKEVANKARNVSMSTDL